MEFIVLDTDFVAVHILDSFESFIWTDRYSSFGDFELYLSPTTQNISTLQEDRYIWSAETHHTMIIENIRITSDVDDGDKLIVTGRSLEAILERRIIWVQTNISGNFQEAINKLLTENVIEPSDSDRTISNFIFEASTDPTITELTIDAQFTGDNLYNVIKHLCDLNNIGFKIVLSENNQFVFSLYSGTDRSYNQTNNPYVIFSPNFDNLINSNYYSSKQTLKTITLVAGEGEGTSRKKVEVAIDTGAETGLNRRELYVDARDISSNNGEISSTEYNELLTQRGKIQLAENTISKAFEGHVDTFHKFVFNVDFFMGDIIQIANEYGIESTSRITEIVRAEDVEGIELFPTFTTIE